MYFISQDLSDDRAVAAQKWLDNSSVIIRNAAEKAPEEAIPELGSMLFKLSLPSIFKSSDRQQAAFDEVQKTLAGIPGHAEYYSARLNAARNKLDLARKANPNEGGILLSDLVNEQDLDFKILGLIPSSETVKVLGEFLSDERGAYLPEKNQYPKVGEHANNEEASRALSKLPFVNRPITIPWQRITSDKVESVMHTWQLWYAQVKAGNRTFRFEGDDKEYSLNGPVTVSTRTSDRSSSAIAASTPPPADAVKPMASVWPMALCIVVVLLLVGGWILIRQRSPRLPRS